MKKFKEEFQSGQPSLRIGSGVPAGAVNLAFFDAPVISPDDTVQLFDRSHSIPENTEVLNIYHTNLFSDDSNRLRNSKGVYKFPINNIIMTDTYYDAGEGEKPVPLYYVANTRFDHYDEGITDTGTFEYEGDNIVILEGEVETEKAYRIFLTDQGGNRFSVTIYSEFIPTDNEIYYVQYNKYDPSTGSVDNNYTEILNASPLFTEDTKANVLVAPAGSNVYCAERLPDEDGFVFYVPNAANVQVKDPILFRWRVIKDGAEQGPWTIMNLHNRDALQEIEYYDAFGNQIYFDQNNRAERILTKPRDHFSGQSGTYTIEVEVLDGSGRTVSINPAGSTDGNSYVYAYTTDNTGTAESEVNEYTISYPVKSFDFTIKAESSYEESYTVPGKTTNVTKLSEGATASSNVASKGYDSYNSVDNTIDGVKPNSHIFGMDVDGNNIFVAYTDESNNPPQNDVTITITLPEDKQIDDLQVRMGNKGSVVSATLKDSGSATIWTGSLTYQGTEGAGKHNQRIWSHTFSPAETAVRYIEVVVRPDKWKTRDYWWLLELFGFRDQYKCGFEVHEINAFERIPPQQGVGSYNWENQVTITAPVSGDLPYRIKFSDILSQYPELVPPANHEDYTVYTISSSDVLGATPSVDNINLYVKDSMFGTVHPDYEITYSQTQSGDPAIVATVDDYNVLVSYRYTVKTEGSDNIFIVQPQYKSFNEMWHLKVNNGRIYLDNYENGIIKEYYIPEFGTQAFDPKQPYKTVVDEEALFIDNRQIRVSNRYLHVEVDGNGIPTNLAVTSNGVSIGIKDWNRFTGDIFLNQDVDINDDVLVSYTYESKEYEYKGFAEITDDPTPVEMFYHLDLNPMPGHTYTYPLDSSGVERPSSELLQKTIYIYINPTYVNDNGSVSGETGSALRHAIYDNSVDETTAWNDIKTDNPHALLLGKVMVQSKHTPKTAVIMDARRRGGGLSDNLTIESIKSLIDESDAVWDVTSWDGHPYPSNGVGIITLPKSILHENGGKFTQEQVREIVNKYIAFGVYAIIRYK